MVINELSRLLLHSLRAMLLALLATPEPVVLVLDESIPDTLPFDRTSALVAQFVATVRASRAPPFTLA